jgi:hypothetical protein
MRCYSSRVDPEMRRLIDDLRTLYSSGAATNKAISEALGIKPPQLSDIWAGRHGLTGDQVFRAQQFLSKFMSTTETPRPTIGHSPDSPKSLSEARDRIESLNMTIATLRAGSPTASNQPITLPTTSAPLTVVARVGKGIQAAGPLQPDALPGIGNAKPLPVQGERPKKIVKTALISEPEVLRSRMREVLRSQRKRAPRDWLFPVIGCFFSRWLGFVLIAGRGMGFYGT